VVIGVSPDDVKKHCKFKKKYGLPYTLIADTDHAVARAYGVWKKKSLFGHKYMGIVRTTFLIDPDGRVARIFEDLKPQDHAREVLAALTALRG
jgi:thioredoxin-dependent peroxiredoxin